MMAEASALDDPDSLGTETPMETEQEPTTQVAMLCFHFLSFIYL